MQDRGLSSVVPLSAIPVRERRFNRTAQPPPTHDIREELFELEEKGELVVHRVPEPYAEVMTKYGRTKKVPVGRTWHHKSCGQCGHIPGYSTSIFWLQRKLGLEYIDPTDQTSCTAWNYYASATSNQAAQAAVAVRNFAAAYETGFYPLIHCGTSFGHYKETRHELVLYKELRDQVRQIMARLGKPLVVPEEIVHYSEWIHAMRHELARHRKLDVSHITVCVHPACHYYKLMAEDALYDEELYGGQRTAIVSATALAMGARVADYSTFFDCCGFGFRHILVQRDFTRSFATLRKIQVMKEEANPDVVLTHDTGCVTTLDKSQFAVRVHGVNVGVPVMSDAQFVALCLGAHPFRVVQLHWHATNWRPLLEKMGIDWQARWAEFEQDMERIRKGEIERITWEETET